MCIKLHRPQSAILSNTENMFRIPIFDALLQINKSHSTSVLQNAHVPQKTMRAVLLRSVARRSSLFPLPTLSTVENESSTSRLMCSVCTPRLPASWLCSSEISRSDFSDAL
jgi:hypothetical protein